MRLIEMDESEMYQSDFTDITLQFILEMYGPAVKDMLLTPREAVVNANRMDTRT